MADNNLADLDPRMQVLCREWMAQCKNAGLDVRVTITWRDAAAQDAAYAAGLSHARAGQSPHECVDANGNPCARAFDFAIFDADGHYITNGEDPRYRQAGEIGEGIGLVYGGVWHHPDWDHLQLAGWKTA